tara:strand:+ start:1229 stop:1867 length:639 start_codon:yes stop_codon:yes gene_type:complete
MKSITSFFPPASAAASVPIPNPPRPSPAEVDSKNRPHADNDEQDFVDFFRGKCKHTTRRNSIVMGRRIAVFGRQHVYGMDVTHPLSEVPVSFVAWAESNKYKFNSITCNLYEDKQDNIAWHSDALNALDSPEVVSLSFALNKEHRGSRLASMEFRWKHGAHPNGSKSKTEALFHGTAVRWNAKKHKKLRCEHRVAATRRPRLNLTLRILKQS